MHSTQISPGVFYVSDPNLSMFYSPKDMLVMEVNDFKPELANSPQFNRFIQENFKNANSPLKEEGLFSFSPTKTNLFLTSNCNSRCVYCYSDGGSRKIDLPFETAKSAIDFIISNAIKKGKDAVKMVYHGGGEPTVNWGGLVQSHDYFRKRAKEEGLKISSGVSTNGAISKEKMIWLAENLSFIQISFDGPPHIQNKQRPLAGDEPSYDIVRANINLLRQYEKDFALRATITKEGLPELSSIVEHLLELSGKGRVHLEPVSPEWGRCLSSGCTSPCDSEIKDAFIDAEKKFGANIIYSGGQLNRITEYFCMGAGKSFCVTPEQKVSSCYEVSLLNDERHRVFFFGEYDLRSKTFIFDMDKLRVLRERKASNMKECSDCFALYNCAGDCLAKSASSGDIFKIPKNSRCESNKGILHHRLSDALFKSEETVSTGHLPFKISKSAKINGVEGLAESVLMCMCRDGSCDTNGGPCRDYD